jgi:DNA-binding NarL/FixJ family response regulator
VASDPERQDLLGRTLQQRQLEVAHYADVVDEIVGADHRVDAVVFDATGHALADAIRAVRALVTGGGDPRVVVVGDALDSAIRRVLRTGAVGYVRAAEIEDALGLAAEAACCGQTMIPMDLRRPAGETALSTREKQILGLVVLGSSNAEIAQQLVVTEATVKTHLSAIFRKLGVRSRKDAAALVLDKEGGWGTGILAITDGGGHGPSYSSS